MPAKTVILIAAPARRDILKQLLTRLQLDLVGELTAATSLHLIAQLAPDIVVLDCAAPQINPLVVLPQLRAHTRAAQIIALSASNTAGERALLRTLGATAYASLDQPGSLPEALAAVGAAIHVPTPARPTAPLGTRGAAPLARRHARHAQSLK